MVLAFFDSQGMVYTNYVPRGSTVNAKYIIRALGTFLKNLRKKRPETAKGGVVTLLGQRPSPHHEGCAGVPREKKTSNCSPTPPIHLTSHQRTTSSSLS